MSKQAYEQIAEGLNEALEMVTTEQLNAALETVGEAPIGLRWADAPYSNGKSKIADLTLAAMPDKLYLSQHTGNTPRAFRYHVRRSSPRSRVWMAKRNGDFFDKVSYSSMEDAMRACEEDAKSPKSTLKKILGVARQYEKVVSI